MPEFYMTFGRKNNEIPEFYNTSPKLNEFYVMFARKRANVLMTFTRKYIFPKFATPRAHCPSIVSYTYGTSGR